MRVGIHRWNLCTPLGDLQQTLAALQSGTSALTSLDMLGLPGETGAYIPDDDDPEDDPGLRILGRHGRMLEPVLRTVHCESHAGAIAREQLGLFVAMGMVDAQPHDLTAAVRSARDEQGTFRLARFFGGAFRLIHPLWPLSMLNNVAGGHFAIDLDIRGDNLVLSSDADSGIRAVLEACASTRAQTVQAALVAGASEAVGAFSIARRQLEGALRPVGEAAAAWLVSADASATTRAWVRGGASTFGACDDHVGPTRDAWQRAIERTLHQAQCTADDITWIVGDQTDPRIQQLAAQWPATRPWDPLASLGALGPASALVSGALAIEQAASSDYVLVLEGSPAGSAAALLLEAA